jgi:hypothetical protein
MWYSIQLFFNAQVVRLKAIMLREIRYSWRLAILQGSLLVGVSYWIQRPPALGVSAASLGLVAIIMSIRAEEKWGKGERTAWLILASALMVVEVRAIQQEHDTHEAEMVAARAKEAKASSEERDRFAALLKQEQQHFETTIKNNSTGQKYERRQFGTLLKKEDDLFVREEQLTEFLNGRLLPASDPMPPTNCVIAGDNVAVFVGSSMGTITNTFPHTIMEIAKHKVVSIDRSESGSLFLTVEMRDSANRIILRLNRNGFVLSSAYDLRPLRPDKSTLIIEDATGNELLHARFLNPQAFSISGTVHYLQKSVPLQLFAPGSSICAYGSGIDISID